METAKAPGLCTYFVRLHTQEPEQKFTKVDFYFRRAINCNMKFKKFGFQSQLWLPRLTETN